MKRENTSIKTKRLIIIPASDARLRDMADSAADQTLGKICEKALAICQASPEDRLWNTVWELFTIDDMTMAGIACFGGPAVSRTVGLTCAVLQEYSGQGYVAEATKALADWALNRNNVCFVETEATGGVSSEELLELGYSEVSFDEGTCYVKERPVVALFAVLMCIGASVGLGIGIVFGYAVMTGIIGVCLGLVTGLAIDLTEKQKAAQYRKEWEALHSSQK